MPFDVAYDVGGNYLSPGFVDIHVHGALGYRFGDGTEEALCTIAALHAKHGTTVLLPALSAMTTENM
ncbi:MAG: hypothetical protein E7399_06215 [Ruminococcaceae bacterium]|nr:hypothetical protein [Oscillospiraceae bacterium]